MTEKELISGTVVKHFKRELIEGEKGTRYCYEILGIGEHTESGERLVIYRALYGDCSIYARPVEMFLSKTDKEKYPGIKQEYRFELLKE